LHLKHKPLVVFVILLTFVEVVAHLIVDLPFPPLTSTFILLDYFYGLVVGRVLVFTLQSWETDVTRLLVLVLVAVAERVLVAGVEHVVALLDLLHLPELARGRDLQVVGRLFQFTHDHIGDEEFAVLGLGTGVLGDSRDELREVLGHQLLDFHESAHHSF